MARDGSPRDTHRWPLDERMNGWSHVVSCKWRLVRPDEAKATTRLLRALYLEAVCWLAELAGARLPRRGYSVQAISIRFTLIDLYFTGSSIRIPRRWAPKLRLNFSLKGRGGRQHARSHLKEILCTPGTAVNDALGAISARSQWSTHDRRDLDRSRDVMWGQGNNVVPICRH